MKNTIKICKLKDVYPYYTFKQWSDYVKKGYVWGEPSTEFWKIIFRAGDWIVSKKIK